MSQRQTRIAWGLLLLTVCFGGIAVMAHGTADGTAAETASTPPAKILPADSVAFFQRDADKAHAAAWKKTAAHAAIYESGLADLGEKVFGFVIQLTGGQVDPRSQALMRHIANNGLSVSVSVPAAPGPPLPRATVVLHNAAPLQANVDALAKMVSGRRVDFQTKTIRSRKVTSGIVAGGMGIEIGWWAEANHLVIVAGLNAVDAAISVAAGETPNLTAHRLWKAQRPDPAGFEVTTRGWLDVAALRERFGELAIPLPNSKPVKVIDGLTALGLDNLQAVTGRSGYKGVALYSTTDVQTKGELRGLLAIGRQRSITLDDLPPLPQNTRNFHAGTLDPSRLYDEITKLARDVAALGPPDAAAQVNGFLAHLPELLGFDSKADLLDALGDVHCMYGDPDQGFFGTGAGLLVQVRDAGKLRKTVDVALSRLAELAGPDFQIHRVKKHGREILTFKLGRQVEIGAVAIDDKWMCLSLMPQTAEAFLLRADGKLASWNPEMLRKQGVGKFTSVTVSDPRVSYHALLKLAPVALTAGVAFLKAERILPRDAELPITLADVPPAELVMQPLFPNVSVATLDQNGMHFVSRKSVPGIPIISGIGGGNTLATGSIAAALLLPAVQQAREAARRAQSKNNLKQLALALHNFHSTYRSFPAGTYPNEKLKPAERLSWLSRILPYVDQEALYKRIDFEGGWQDKENAKPLNARVQVFTNPGYAADQTAKFGLTHYVGIAGLGKDGPMLPVTNKRAGIFAYNRKTRVRDIRDGTSNTLMIAEASKNFGAWGAGGPASIRPFTKKPYINGPDGIGGPFTGGCHFSLADGSVRFVSKNIDPKVMESLTTINGGEVIPAF